MSYEIQEIVKMSEGADIIAKDWLHLKRGTLPDSDHDHTHRRSSPHETAL